MKIPGIIVTTSKRPTYEIEQAARAIALRCSVPYVPRKQGRIISVERLCSEHEAKAAYVVSRQRHEIRALGGGQAFVNPGPLHVFLRVGRSHPLIRALCPPGEAELTHMVDATLGLAKNAICIAAVFGCEVLGLESSPLMTCLLEEGLPRLIREEGYWSEPASHVSLHHADASEWLESAGADMTDVVYLDPMFEAPIPHPMTDVFRLIADTRPLSGRLLNAALRAAKRRVVYRIPSTLPTKSAGPVPGIWTTRVRGKHVDYLVAPARSATVDT